MNIKRKSFNGKQTRGTSEIREQNNMCLYYSISVFALLPCLKVVHYALTIPSAIILMSFAAELSLRKYLRKRVRELDKS